MPLSVAMLRKIPKNIYFLLHDIRRKAKWNSSETGLRSPLLFFFSSFSYMFFLLLCVLIKWHGSFQTPRVVSFPSAASRMLCQIGSRKYKDERGKHDRSITLPVIPLSLPSIVVVELLLSLWSSEETSPERRARYDGHSFKNYTRLSPLNFQLNVFKTTTSALH